MSKRTEYIEKLEARLEELDAELQKLEARMKAEKAEARLEVRRRMEELRSRRDDLTDRFQKLQKAGEDSWKALREGTEEALTTFTDGLAEAKEKLEPVLAGTS